MLFCLLVHPCISSEEDEKKIYFVGGRQPHSNWAGEGWQWRRFVWGGGGSTRQKEYGRYDDIDEEDIYFFKMPTRRYLWPQALEDMLSEGERLWRDCFKWVAALGHMGRSRVRSSHHFDPSPLQHLFVWSQSFIFLCCLQLCAILQPLCFLIAGRGRSSSGQGSWPAGEIYYHAQTYVSLRITPLALFIFSLQSHLCYLFSSLLSFVLIWLFSMHLSIHLVSLPVLLSLSRVGDRSQL